MFVLIFQLAFSAKKLKRHTREQIINFLTGFWNGEKQVSKKMN
jgi:hypothetical protein